MADHDLVRNTIRTTIERYPDIAVVGEADCGEAGLEVAARTNPDVVIVDTAPAMRCYPRA
jgi:two-component system nitrate/nitrite response regulator NarL